MAGFFDKFLNRLVPGDQFSRDDKKGLLSRGLLEAGLTAMATPTGTGSAFMGISRGLLGGLGGVREGARDMEDGRMRQAMFGQQKAKADAEQAQMAQAARVNELRRGAYNPDGSINPQGMMAFRAEFPMEAIEFDKAANPQADLPSAVREAQYFAEHPELLGTYQQMFSAKNPASMQYVAGLNMAFNPRTNQLEPLANGPQMGTPTVPPPTGAPSPTTPPSANGAFAALLKIPGVQFTSGYRDPAKNKEVGGVDNSFHLTGEGGDFVVPPEHKQGFINQARMFGLEVKDEGDHMHVEPAGSPQQAGNSPVAAPPVAAPSTTPPPRMNPIVMENDAPLTVVGPARAWWQTATPEQRQEYLDRESGAAPAISSARPTEDMSKAAGWLSQAQLAVQNMRDAIAKDPTADEASLLERVGGAIPFVGDYAERKAQSPQRQRFVDAAASLAEAVLRAATGAGVNKDEAEQKKRELTPQLGDSDEVIEQKMANAENYLRALEARAGSAAMPAPGAAGSGWKIEVVK